MLTEKRSVLKKIAKEIKKTHEMGWKGNQKWGNQIYYTPIPYFWYYNLLFNYQLVVDLIQYLVCHIHGLVTL